MNQLKNNFEQFGSVLTLKEQDVIRLRFGTEDERQRSCEEIGKIFGVSEERIKVIEAGALRKLRCAKFLKSSDKCESAEIFNAILKS